MCLMVKGEHVNNNQTTKRGFFFKLEMMTNKFLIEKNRLGGREDLTAVVFPHSTLRFFFLFLLTRQVVLRTGIGRES